MKRNRLVYVVGGALLLAASSGCVDTRKSTGQNIDESTLSMKANSALANRSDFNARDVRITVDGGVVQLSGYVDHPAHIPRAEKVVRSIEGVKAVQNQLRVRPKHHSYR